MKVRLAIALIGLASAALAGPATVEPQILRNLEKSSTTNVLVTFRKSDSRAAMTRFKSLGLTSRNAKLTTMHSILKDHADFVQADVISMLEKSRSINKKNIRQLWITAELIVRDADSSTIEALKTHPDVKSLVAERFFPLEPIKVEKMSRNAEISAVQWGVDRVNAPKCWNAGTRTTGENIVVANIDTGVRYTHESLRNNFRAANQEFCNYAWYDPSGQTYCPNDADGHGTHTMGTICGQTNGIGVAPGATWVACRGCGTGSCSSFDLYECGEWVACPTTTSGASPDCSKAPDVVSNSWGGGQGDTWYDHVIIAWREAGIVPLFSAGNSGPRCGTANSPGDCKYTLSVGSTNYDATVSSFSSCGPTKDGRIKPDISAPGYDIFSAYYTSDTAYATMSGTSMACPHAAGVCALILSDNPDLTVEEVEDSLIAGCQHITSSGKTCGKISDDQYPNNQLGKGRIDAYNSTNYARAIYR